MNLCGSTLHPLSAGKPGGTLVDPITYQCSSLCSVTYEIHLEPRKSWNCLKRLKWLEKCLKYQDVFGENWGINGWTVAWIGLDILCWVWTLKDVKQIFHRFHHLISFFQIYWKQLIRHAANLKNCQTCLYDFEHKLCFVWQGQLNLREE